MKTIFLILLLSAVTFVGAAAAYDGQVTFEGSITDVTCVVTGGQDGGTLSTSGSFIVNLPAVSTTALAKSGQRAGDSKFSIYLSGAQCENDKIANVSFEEAQSDIDSATGNLSNLIAKASGGSENVQIKLLNKDKTDINLNSASNHQPVKIASNTARFDYWAQYYATGQATAGKVRGLVTYSIVYN